MASSKKKTEIRQAPKHLDKMLFNNYREEERLQQKLKDLTNNSRMRGIELDRQKVQVHNEMRLNKRRNSVSAIPPVVSRATTATTAQQSASTVIRPNTRERAGGPPFRRRDDLSVASVGRPSIYAGNRRVMGNGGVTRAQEYGQLTASRPNTRERAFGPPFRRRGSTADPGNEYILTEFRRMSEIIPGILSSLNKDATEGKEGEREGEGPRAGGGGGGAKGRVRRATVAGLESSAISSLATPLVRLDPDLKAFASKETGHSEDDPNIGNIVSLIRSIRTLREDITGKKRYDLTKARTSFDDMLKNIHEEERRGSDSDTFTDGACALLRRKMHKARRASCPSLDPLPGQAGDSTAQHATSGGSAQQQRRVSRSNTTLASLGRHESRDAESMRTLLQEEIKQLTELKVASEWRRYDDIRMRIGNFLGPPDRRVRRISSLPVLQSCAEVVQEEAASTCEQVL